MTPEPATTPTQKPSASRRKPSRGGSVAAPVVQVRRPTNQRWYQILLTPGTVTVIVTAVVGPIAVTATTNILEKKKLQAQVIESVLRYTDNADFRDPAEVMRAGLIAKLVHENVDVFGLRFSKAETEFALLADNLHRAGLAKANETVNTLQNEVFGLRGKLRLDSIAIVTKTMEKDRLERQLRNDRGLTEKHKQVLRDSIATHVSAISTLSADRAAVNAQLQRVSQEHAGALRQLATANAELDRLQSESTANAERLTAQEVQLGAMGRNADSLRIAVQSLTKDWRQASDQVESWKRIAEAETKRANELQAQLTAYLSKAPAEGTAQSQDRVKQSSPPPIGGTQ